LRTLAQASSVITMFHEVEEEWDREVRGGDPLAYPGYAEDLAALDAGSEAVRTGRTASYAFVEGRFDVFGGSMGAAAGERVVRAYDAAAERSLPVVVLTRTGGARMQEGMVSLVQLARTADAARRHRDAGLLSLAIHAHPSTGGVLVSYAAQADLRVAHRGATIGFAGPRVAEAITGAPLPEGSHSAEVAHDAGLLDGLLEPGEEAAWIESALGLRDDPLPTRPLPAWSDPDAGGAWGEVLRARGDGRPTGVDRAARLCRSWIELRGADPVVRAGLAKVGDRRVVVVATDRYAGSGRPAAAGYRLVRRAIGLAERLGLPVLTLVDTPGADPSSEAERAGIVPEIAETFGAMASLTVPTVSVCVGEGGSGGALAMAYADRLLIQEHAIFSVIGPEGAAAILERDPTQAPAVAERLGLTSRDLARLGIVDEVVPEGQESLEVAVLGALADATVGDRRRRFDEATARWLR
jgi:acyl-CoA carboxylase subunit beta